MKRITYRVFGPSLSALLILTGPAAVAAPLELKLPPETAKLRPSKLPGHAVAAQKCAICHSVDYINFQPPGMNQSQWTAEVGKMQHAYGAPISDEEVKQIGAYLAVAYGTAKATDPGVISVSATTTPAPAVAQASTPSSPTNAVGAVDVKTLLTANGCLACHAIDKKIVGPAYHDVAAKYKGDAQAASKLSASIRQGSVGKWGQIPMPPFTTLSESDAKALASFVLGQ